MQFKYRLHSEDSSLLFGSHLQVDCGHLISRDGVTEILLLTHQDAEAMPYHATLLVLRLELSQCGGGEGGVSRVTTPVGLGLSPADIQPGCKHHQGAGLPDQGRGRGADLVLSSLGRTELILTTDFGGT